MKTLSELRKSTIKSYLSKTVDPIEGMPKPDMAKRMKGIGAAHQRLVGKKPTSEEYNPYEENQLTENFKDLKSAISHASTKVKTHRDPDDGIEVYKLKSGGYDVNHTMNSSGRNALMKSGAKHLGTVSRDSKMNVTHNIKEEAEQFNEAMKPYVLSTAPKMGEKGSHDVMDKEGKVVKSYPYSKSGMQLAKMHLNKLKEDVEQVDELKISTMLRYATRANKSLLGGDRSKEEKRIKGIQTANYKIKQQAAKVTKEETDQVSEETHYNDDDYYIFHKKTHKMVGSKGASSITAKRLKMQFKDKPDYDQNHYAVRGMQVKSHLASLNKSEDVMQNKFREKIFKTTKNRLKALYKNAHPAGNKRSDV
jgi:hypothetical protein